MQEMAKYEQTGEKTSFLMCSIKKPDSLYFKPQYWITDRYQTCSIEFSCFLAKCMIFYWGPDKIPTT